MATLYLSLSLCIDIRLKNGHWPNPNSDDHLPSAKHMVDDDEVKRHHEWSVILDNTRMNPCLESQSSPPHLRTVLKLLKLIRRNQATIMCVPKANMIMATKALL